ncbi:MAG: helix-turn-helix domain-containing protein [Balneolales bacterium]
MNIKPIHTKHDYQRALERVQEIFNAKPGTTEGDELEVLGILVDNYENQHFTIESPNPVEAVTFRMEQLGLRQADLARILGSRSRASEILSGKRSFSLRHIKILNKKLGIPADVLLQDQEPVT